MDSSGPAFGHLPTVWNDAEHKYELGQSIDGMSLRQYAAIKLRVPDSGTDWLDEMIRVSLRDDFARRCSESGADAAIPNAVGDIVDMPVMRMWIG